MDTINKTEDVIIGVNVNGVPFEPLVPIEIEIDEHLLEIALRRFPEEISDRLPNVLDGELEQKWDNCLCKTIAGYDYVDQVGNDRDYGLMYFCGDSEGNAIASLRLYEPSESHWGNTPDNIIRVSVDWDSIYNGVEELSGWHDYDRYEVFVRNQELVYSCLMDVLGKEIDAHL